MDPQSVVLTEGQWTPLPGTGMQVFLEHGIPRTLAFRTAPGPSGAAIPGITSEELGLLRSYADGPVIWDVWDTASIMPVVYRLHDLGLVERVPSGHGAYSLTPAGSQVLAEAHGSQS
jgi:hypothetical protein